MGKKDKTACPAHAGTMTGYRPEYKNADGIWKDVPASEACVRFTTRSITRHPFGEMYYSTDTLPYEMSMAIAWAYMAEHTGAEVRLVPYKITFDVKAEKDEDKAKYLEDPVERIRKE